MSSLDDHSVDRLVSELHTRLFDVRDPDKGLKLALKLARLAFEANSACLAMVPPGSEQAVVQIRNGAAIPWDLDLLARFLRGERPKLNRQTLLGVIERRGRPWAVLGLQWRNPSFEGGALRAISRVADAISIQVQRLDRERISEVRARIDGQMMDQHRPKDLFYQILHGLRTLTRYDHSASLLTFDEGTHSLELVADQIAWRKGKSQLIGKRVKVDDNTRKLLQSGEVLGFDRIKGRWVEWSGRQDFAVLAETLDLNFGIWEEGRDRSEDSLLCAPLATRQRLLGVLKVASVHPSSLGPYEGDLVKRFLPQAAVAIRNLRRTESLREGLLAAEKKHVLAELARGVSHDINNAIGSVLPLIQQLLVEAREGQVSSEVLAEDLERIEESLKVCRRIFDGMLAFSKGSSPRMGDGDLRRAVERALGVLADSLRRHSVSVEHEVPMTGAAVGIPQGDLEQLILNLATNARDAMPDGGKLSIRAREIDGAFEILVEDDGHGIDPELRSHIHEPFFTTKRTGNGLGLSICGSILSNAQGRLTIQSEPGRGTCVKVHIPSAAHSASAAGASA